MTREGVFGHHMVSIGCSHRCLIANHACCQFCP
jgi:hypothetical protein